MSGPSYTRLGHEQLISTSAACPGSLKGHRFVFGRLQKHEVHRFTEEGTEVSGALDYPGLVDDVLPRYAFGVGPFAIRRAFSVAATKVVMLNVHWYVGRLPVGVTNHHRAGSKPAEMKPALELLGAVIGEEDRYHHGGSA